MITTIFLIPEIFKTDCRIMSKYELSEWRKVFVSIKNIMTNINLILKIKNVQKI